MPDKMCHIVPSKIEIAHCPYEYEGTIGYDTKNNLYFCNKCNRIVKVIKW